MKLDRLFLLIAIAALCFAIGCTQTPQTPQTPQINVSPTRIPHPGDVVMRGTGFTPKAAVSSHLRRPDGTEFPVLEILTDARGEFTHEIDSLLLPTGTHDLWVVDDPSGVTSNIARFDVTLEQVPLGQ